MTERDQQLNVAQDPEATVVSSIFDDGATVIAQPVVPLDDKAVTEDVGAYVNTGTAPPVYTRAWKRRSQLTIAFVVAALFTGTVAGIVGLRLYQRSRAAVPTPTAVEQTQTATEEAQPLPTDSPTETTSEVEQPQPSAEPSTVVADEEKKADVATVKASATEIEKSSESAVRGETTVKAERVGAVKHGKKGEAEAEPERIPVYVPRENDISSPEAERRAQREENRLRRAEREARREARRARRENRARAIDSVRGIFEGRGESPPR